MMTKYLFIFHKRNIKNLSGIYIYGVENTNDLRMWRDSRVKHGTEIGLGGGKDVTERDGTWINGKFSSRLILSHSFQARVFSRFVPYHPVPSYPVPSPLVPSRLVLSRSVPSCLIPSYTIQPPTVPSSFSQSCPIPSLPTLSRTTYSRPERSRLVPSTCPIPLSPTLSRPE